MTINLTKLLNVPKNLYTGIYGETSWVGILPQWWEPSHTTSPELPYAFDLGEEPNE